MTNTMTTALHTAYLDAMAGVGLLAIPADDGTDLWLDTSNLTHADMADMLNRLHVLGWRLVTDDDGLWRVVGQTLDGRDVLLLGADDPITTEPTPDEIASAMDELHREAGLLA